MTVALRPAAIKMLLIAAGVLLGLLDHRLDADARGARGARCRPRREDDLHLGKLHPLSVRWH